MASYPNSLWTHVPVIDNVDTVVAQDINDPSAEIIAIETELGLLPKQQSASVSGFLADLMTGWIKITDAWTYNSVSGIAGVVNVPSDATTRYSKGDRIRFKQGGAYKYFAVYAVTATTLYITGGTDYTLTNAAITDIYYSKFVSPLGYPTWFSYTPTLTWSAGVAPAGAPTVYNKFKIDGSAVTLDIFQYGFTAGTNVVSLQCSVPIASPGNQSGCFGYCQNANTPNLSYAQVATTVVYIFCTSVAAERFQISGTYVF